MHGQHCDHVRPIEEVASDLGLEPSDLMLFGRLMAKVEPHALRQGRRRRGQARLVLVSGITPTAAGEGKTTVSIGLADAFRLLDKSVCLALREPSLGPCFGIKGGGTGGGAASLVPADRINLHFTGDFHAVTAAHNLLAAPGNGIVVAVVDSGLSYPHAEIAGTPPSVPPNVWINAGEDINHNGLVDGTNTCPAINGDFNCRDDDNNGFVDDLRGWDFVNNDNDPADDNGHGTHVAGTIGAIANNNVGIAGVAPHAKIMPLKAFNAQGNRGPCSGIFQALTYLTGHGADVDNNSWAGRQGDCPSLHDAIQYAYSHGVVVVDAAGNNGSEAAILDPASFLESITVAAFEQNDQQTAFTNFGSPVDVAAPGGGPGTEGGNGAPRSNILSLSFAGSTLESKLPANIVAPGYIRLARTSMATPHVAGVAALLLSRNPQLTVEQVRHALRVSAVDVAAAGWDVASGFGRVNALNAITLPVVPTARLTNVEHEQHIFGTTAVQIQATAGGSGTSITSWTLSYQPVGGTSWTVISQGSSAPPASVNWVTRGLRAGSYLIRIQVQNSAGRTATDIRRVFRSFYQDVSPGNIPPSSQGTNAMKGGDLDGDRDIDIFKCNATGPVSDILNPSQELWINSGIGAFTDASTRLPAARNIFCVDAEVVDVDRDGNLDIVVVGESGQPDGGPSHRVWINTGGANFQDQSATRLPLPLAAAGTYGNASAGDIDRDGDVDLVITDPPAVLVNNGSGVFTNETATRFAGFQPCGGTFCDVELADIDVDGDLDIVCYAGIGVNDGSGRFLLRQISNPWGNRRVAIGDFNADGYPDVVAEELLYLNNRSGSFAAPVTIIPNPVGPVPAVADINLDCNPDVFVSSGAFFQKNFALFNDGAGNMSAATGEVYMRPNPAAASVFADVTGDGYGDEVIGGFWTGSALLRARFDDFLVCTGDCHGDGQVTVDELLTMVNMRLGNYPLCRCVAGDSDHDGRIECYDVNSAVNNALNGCSTGGSGLTAGAATVADGRLMAASLLTTTITQQIGSAAGTRGAAVTIPVTVTGGAGILSAVDLDILYPTSILTNVRCAKDPRLTNHSLSWSQPTTPPAPSGKTRISTMIADLSNASTMTDGRTFSCTFTIRASAPLGTYALTGEYQVGSDSRGNKIVSTVTGGSVTVR